MNAITPRRLVLAFRPVTALDRDGDGLLARRAQDDLLLTDGRVIWHASWWADAYRQRGTGRCIGAGVTGWLPMPEIVVGGASRQAAAVGVEAVLRKALERISEVSGVKAQGERDDMCCALMRNLTVTPPATQAGERG